MVLGKSASSKQAPSWDNVPVLIIILPADQHSNMRICTCSGMSRYGDNIDWMKRRCRKQENIYRLDIRRRAELFVWHFKCPSPNCMLSLVLGRSWVLSGMALSGNTLALSSSNSSWGRWYSRESQKLRLKNGLHSALLHWLTVCTSSNSGQWKVWSNNKLVWKTLPFMGTISQPKIHIRYGSSSCHISDFPEHKSHFWLLRDFLKPLGLSMSVLRVDS